MASIQKTTSAKAGPGSSKAARESMRGHEQEDQADQAESISPEPETLSKTEDTQSPETTEAPPLPSGEEPPPLPTEAIPGQEPEDDGWEPVWDDTTQAYYFFNRITNKTQWENPRVVEDAAETKPAERPHGGYDPAIHGSYDPTADYAQAAKEQNTAVAISAAIPANTAVPDYSASGHFNRFTGKWQADTIRAENYSDEAKSTRQMSAFFDVDAAANAHNGKSLKAERANKKLSKAELKAFKEKRKEKKEEKRRAWLRD